MTQPRATLSAVDEERTLSWARAKRRYLAAAAVVTFFVWPLFVLDPVELVAVTVYFAAMSILFLAPARLHIGTDDIMLRWLGERSFIGYDEIVGLVNFERNWATSGGSTHSARAPAAHRQTVRRAGPVEEWPTRGAPTEGE